jgi:omega-amidase
LQLQNQDGDTPFFQGSAPLSIHIIRILEQSDQTCAMIRAIDLGDLFMQLVVVQIDTAWEQREANHEKVRGLLAAAPVKPGALVVLPEMFDTGFTMNARVAAHSEQHQSEAFLRRLARELDVAVLAGVIGQWDGESAANEAVAFAPDGGELVRYRKQQPFSPMGEQQLYRAGDCHQLFSWADTLISPFICYDLRFPEIFRPAARAGAELLLVIASWPTRRSEHWVRLLQARAIENQAFAVGVNRCGNDPYTNYDGRTVGFDPHGHTLFEADERAQTITVEIDPQQARDWRKEFPALKDMRG